MIGEENIDKHDFASKYKNKKPKKKNVSDFCVRVEKTKKIYFNDLKRTAT